jgi:lipid II:glycine glycyltransferase (peptidoglycan interpeptide bridge formation enzyme)
MNWEEVNISDNEWDNKIANLFGVSYLHYSYWANHLNNFGWKTTRWICNDNNQNISYLQGFYKSYPFKIIVLWFPEWIVGNLDNGKYLQESLIKKFNNKLLYVRFRSSIKYEEEKINDLNNQNWLSPNNKMSMGLNMQLDLSKTMEDLEDNLTKNWKRNLKRSKNKKINIKKIDTSSEIINIYEQMKQMKQIKNIYNSDEISSIYKNNRKNLIVLSAENFSNTPIAIRGAIIIGEYAWDIFAATNSEARKNYASYALFWELIKYCKKNKCKNYDLNGVNPSANLGVYNFKKGTGSKLIEEIGEFEWSNSFILKSLVNLKVSIR